MECDDETKVAGTIAVLAAKAPKSGFRAAIAQVRKEGRPMTLDLTESAMDKLGGAAHLGEMIAEDIKRIRGDDKTEEARMFHEVDYKVLFRGYDSLLKLSTARDEMVGGNTDPLDELSEDDLMAVASQAAFLQVEVDPDFRRAMLQKLIELEPQAILDAAAEAVDVLLKTPRASVTVVGEA